MVDNWESEGGFTPGEEDGYDEALDPFSPTNAPKLSLVVLMRLYDVGMALLYSADQDAARRLHKVHEAGGIVGSEPYLDLRSEDEDSTPA